jgi:hypothetical protein
VYEQLEILCPRRYRLEHLLQIYWASRIVAERTRVTQVTFAVRLRRGLTFRIPRPSHLMVDASTVERLSLLLIPPAAA